MQARALDNFRRLAGYEPGDIFACLACHAIGTVDARPGQTTRPLYFGIGCPRCGYPDARRYRAYRAAQTHLTLVEPPAPPAPDRVRRTQTFIDTSRRSIPAGAVMKAGEAVDAAMNRAKRLASLYEDVYAETPGNVFLCMAEGCGNIVFTPEKGSGPKVQPFFGKGCPRCGQPDDSEFQAFLHSNTTPAMQEKLRLLAGPADAPELDLDSWFEEEELLQFEVEAREKHDFRGTIMELQREHHAKNGYWPAAVFVCMGCLAATTSDKPRPEQDAVMLFYGMGCCECGYVNSTRFRRFGQADGRVRTKPEGAHSQIELLELNERTRIVAEGKLIEESAVETLRFAEAAKQIGATPQLTWVPKPEDV
jgi:ribosomal protein L37E